jgi:hypothetical protein
MKIFLYYFFYSSAAGARHTSRTMLSHGGTEEADRALGRSASWTGFGVRFNGVAYFGERLCKYIVVNGQTSKYTIRNYGGFK